MGDATIPALQILLWRDKNIRSFVLVLSVCSLFLVAGLGMAEELQHSPGAKSANSTAGFNNIIILLANMFIFDLQCVETMRIEMFWTFVK